MRAYKGEESQKMKRTPMELMKELKSNENEIKMLLEIEQEMSTFTSAISEADVVRPEYDYAATSDKIEQLQKRTRDIKHALNKFNTTTVVPDFGCTVDELLILIPQLTERKKTLREMALRKQYSKPEMRYGSGANPDYVIANYDINQAKKDYDIVSEKLSSAQLALDKLNSEAEIDIDF